MKHKLQKIKEESQELSNEIYSDLHYAHENLNQVVYEQHRVTELSGQAGKIIDQIDLSFKTQTKLSSVDIVFLFLATAFQCARQYLLPNDALRLTDKEGDALKKKILNAKIGNWQPVPPDTASILCQSVPYDAFTNKNISLISDTGIGGSTHRYRTLGHDPVLGWIFGTANIMTNSLSRYDFTTFWVQNNVIIDVYPLGTPGMIQNAIQFSQQDSSLLPTALLRQAIHYGSDYFTKQGLPVPLLSTANNDLTKAMITEGSIDMWSISRGAVLSTFINQLIATLHRLLYDPQRDGSPSLYEVRTRKILSYSNALATGSNIVVSAFTKDATKLDVGGMLVTIHRMVADYQFIHEIKKDFLKNELYDRIVGTEYDFMRRNI